MIAGLYLNTMAAVASPNYLALTDYANAWIKDLEGFNAPVRQRQQVKKELSDLVTLLNQADISSASDQNHVIQLQTTLLERLTRLDLHQQYRLALTWMDILVSMEPRSTFLRQRYVQTVKSLIDFFNTLEATDPQTLYHIYVFQTKMIANVKIHTELLQALSQNVTTPLTPYWLNFSLDLMPRTPEVRSKIIDLAEQALVSQRLPLQIWALSILGRMVAKSNTTHEVHQIRAVNVIRDALSNGQLTNPAVHAKGLALLIDISAETNSKNVLKLSLQALFQFLNPVADQSTGQQLTAQSIGMLKQLNVRISNETGQLELLNSFRLNADRIFKQKLIDRANGFNDNVANQMIEALAELEPLSIRVAVEKTIYLARVVRMGMASQQRVAKESLLKSLAKTEALVKTVGHLDRFHAELLGALTSENWPESVDSIYSLQDQNSGYAIEILAKMKITNRDLRALRANRIASALHSVFVLVRTSAANHLAELVEGTEAQDKEGIAVVIKAYVDSLRKMTTETFAVESSDILDRLFELLKDPKVSQAIPVRLRSLGFKAIKDLGTVAHKTAVDAIVENGAFTCDDILDALAKSK